ncbi:MAG: hypothetical protein HWN65_00275 [Candidatus Helarchaeota archaeon]|nr:hypothetical protein [Candidatus Helarchaeota archaeon]
MSQDQPELRINNQSINITTPANTTYFEPMRGFYPGTQGFEEVTDGSLPTGWSYSGGSSAEVTLNKIDSNGKNHRKVLRCYSGPAVNSWITVTNQFVGPQTSGTVEFWFLVIENTSRTFLGLKMSSSYRIMMYQDANLFRYYDGFTDIITGINFDSNKWYRFSIDFSSDGTYSGLAANYYRFRIFDSDGVTMLYTSPDAQFFSDGTIDRFEIYALMGPATVYADALGYSWDSSYSIGDNKYEGLHLNFSTTITPQWSGYSLDGQNNITILGNTTIPAPPDGSHNIQIFANDTNGTFYQSAVRHFTTNLPPYITINSPKPGDTFDLIAPSFNVEITGPELDTMWYTIDGGLTNVTFSTNETINQTLWDAHSIGPATIRFFANDSTNIIGSAKVVIKKILVQVNISSPENRSYTVSDKGHFVGSESFEDIADGTLPANWVHTEIGSSGTYSVVVNNKTDRNDNIHKKVMHCYDGASDRGARLQGFFNESQTSGTYEFWILELNPGSDRLRFSLRNTFDQDAVYLFEMLGRFFYRNGFSQVDTGISFIENKWYRLSIDFSDDGTYAGLGAHQYRLRIYDSDGISLLYTSPNANFGYNGHLNSLYIYTSVWLSHEVFIDAVGYLWDPDYTSGDNLIEGLFLNFTTVVDLNWRGYSIDGQNNVTIYDNVTIPFPSEGPHSIQVFGNTSLGTMYASEVRYFEIDFLPQITINSPSPSEGFGISAPSFNVTIIDPNLDTMWYSIDGGLNNRTFLVNGTINQTLWDARANGVVTITFYANDSWGNVHSAEVQVIKDTRAPIILINNPTPNEIFGSVAPPFNIEIIDLTLNTMWYTLDGGVTNTTFLSNESINQPLWDALTNGFVTIKFYVNDSQNNITSAEVTIKKDVIMINFPIPYEVFGEITPPFNVEISDPNLHTMWYTIDGGIFNQTFLTNQSIVQGLWDVQGYGNVTLRFYANDTFGFEWFSEVVLIKAIVEITIISPQNITYQPPLPGLPLDFLTVANFDWMAYSLDGQDNVTIPGNTSIALPENGPHTIQIFGNHSRTGTMFQSEIRPFIIAPNAPVLDPIVPVADIDGKINLNWSDVTGAMNYYIYRNTSIITSLNGLTPIAVVLESNYTDTLTKNGQYHWVIIASDSWSNSSLSNCESVTVAIPPTAPVLDPILPSFDTDGLVLLEWNDVVGADIYYVYRNTSNIISVGGLTPITAVTESTFTDIITDIGIYYYVIVTGNDLGNSSISNCENVTVGIPPVLAPIIPLIDIDGTLDLNWSSVAGAQLYYIYKDAMPISSVSGLTPLAILSETNYTHSYPVNGIYYFVIVAGNPLVNSSLSNCANVTVAIPPNPPDLQTIFPIVDVDGIIQLTWTTIKTATFYQVYRDSSNISSVAGLTPIATISTNFFIDVIMSSGNYYYVIVAGNATGTSYISNCEMVTVTLPSEDEDGTLKSDITLLAITILIAGIAIAGAILAHGMLRRPRAPPPPRPPKKVKSTPNDTSKAS